MNQTERDPRWKAIRDVLDGATYGTGRVEEDAERFVDELEAENQRLREQVGTWKTRAERVDRGMLEAMDERDSLRAANEQLADLGRHSWAEVKRYREALPRIQTALEAAAVGPMEGVWPALSYAIQDVRDLLVSEESAGEP